MEVSQMIILFEKRKKNEDISFLHKKMRTFFVANKGAVFILDSTLEQNL